VNNELRTWKEAVVDYFKVISCRLQGLSYTMKMSSYRPPWAEIST